MFGEFARMLSNRKWCSVDSFAFAGFQFGGRAAGRGDDGWTLSAASAEDLFELVRFYECSSGGLAMKALELEPEAMGRPTIDGEFAKLGLKREKTLFSLTRGGKLKAIFMALVSDMGLNMSGLTNCIHVFVTDSEGLTSDVLYRHLDLLSPRYSEAEIPLLVYPVSFVDDQSIPHEKVYNLWAFDTRYTSRFYEYMQRILKKKDPAATRSALVRSVS